MAGVKRFRPLGEVRKCESVSSDPGPLISESEYSLIHSKRKTVRRFKYSSKPRKVRSDKKHQFPLRVEKSLWSKIEQLSFDAGGLRVGASLNVICNRLLALGVEDPGFVKQILSEFPENDQLIMVRSWGGDR